MGGEKNMSLEDIAREIDSILEGFRDEDEGIRERVKKLVELIEDFNRTGILEIVRFLKRDSRGKDLLMEMVREPSIYGLFLKHGIIRPDAKTQVALLLEKIRPYIRSHGGDVEFVDLRGDTVIIKMFGSCVGCSQIDTTLREGILEVIRGKLPSVKNVRVIPVKARGGECKEKKVIPLDSLGEGVIHHYKDGETDIILVSFNGGLYAYYNACPHQGLALDGGELCGDILTCPWHGFKYSITSGECLTVNYLQLEPVEVSVKDGWVWVAS